MSEPTPFKIAVSDKLLSFIKQRVETARIPPGLNLPESEAWAYGVPPATITHLQQYWLEKYDWRAVEARINAHLKMFTMKVEEAGEELEMHFVHHQSEREGAVPLLFQHGWPGNFLEVERMIDQLTSPQEVGAQAYHVVAPSLPGFVFSEGPKGDFALKNIAAMNNKLMCALGYTKYIAQGGDWGSIVARILAVDFPKSCVAIHLNMTLGGPPSWWKHPLTLLWFVMWAIWQDKGKETMLGRAMWWQREESGYLEIQGTKPQTLSYALVDSPLGMLAWLRDKMEPLVDDDFKWTDEDVITWAMMYIIPGSSGHAHIYTNAKGKKLKQFQSDLKPILKNVDVGASLFPKEVYNIPQWWAACTVASNIVFWKEHNKGGHFPSIERPEVLVDDIREFTKVIEKGRMAELVKSGKLQVQ